MAAISKPEVKVDEIPALRPPGVGLGSVLARLPYWFIALLIIGLLVAQRIRTDATYSQIFNQLREGVFTTLYVSFWAFGISLLLGLVLGLVRANPPKAIGRNNPLQVFLYNLATLYVEVFRGLPVLVVLLITAFVVVPLAIDFLNDGFVWNIGGVRLAWGGVEPDINIRNVSITWRAIIALALTYGAFLSEVFRAGIQSVPRGQREAAMSLGMNRTQVMGLIVLPQAVRRVLPPLGNDLVAMIKDSSLVAILAVRDITQIAKLSAGQSFLYLETYLIAAAIYLLMTLLGSLLVRGLERWLGTTGH